MICIYHSRDLDGWMSAAVVKLKFPDVELIGWDYGQPIPDLNPEKHSELIMVDISFPPEIMESLRDPFNLIWIDHHLSAIQQNKWIEGSGFGKGIRRVDFAACELTWKFFFPDQEMPEIVRLLGRYDCFGHKGTAEELTVLQFQYGARAAISNPDDAYKYLSRIVNCPDPPETTTFHNILDNGRAIYKYLCTEAQQTYAKRFSTLFDGHTFACVNQERFNPINFGIDYHKDGYDGFACFWYNKGKWSFSLYNDNGLVDCSEICKSRGGGGHKGASGFVTDNIDWLFPHE